MAYTLQENIAYTGNQPNFARDRVRDLDELKAADSKSYDIGHIVYCSAEKKHYKFVGSSEEYNEVTGYFREFGDAGETYEGLTEEELDNILK